MTVRKAKKRSKGLGDTIEKVTKATGIKKVVDLLFDDCGCDKRKEQLNKIFPYKVECLNEDEYIFLKDFFKNYKSSINYNNQVELIKIYNRVFRKKQKITKCGSCWDDIIKRLKRVYNEYL